MPHSKPLPKLQRRLLQAAADHPTCLILPFPTEVALSGAGRQRLLARLLKAGLVEEAPSTDPASIWRTDETEAGFALRLAAPGFAAIGRSPPEPHRRSRAHGIARRTRSSGQAVEAVPPSAADEVSAAPAKLGRSTPSDPPVPQQPGGKLGQVLTTLSTEAGATLAELVALTGWQPHTTRAALTRLRQRGHALVRHETAGRKAYRLNAAG